MRSLFAVIRQLVLPAGSGPNAPQVVIGPDLPPELLAKYSPVLNNTPNAGILFRQNATRYSYYVNTPQLHAVGSVEAAVVNELYRTSAFGTTAEQVYGGVPVTTNDYEVTFGIGNGASKVFLDTTMQVNTITGTTVGKIEITTDTVAAANLVISNSPSGVGTTVSATYAAMPGTPGGSITKAYPAADTSLEVHIDQTAFMSVGVCDLEIGVRINGATTKVCQFFFSNTGIRHQLSGTAKIAGLAAGLYTVELMWRRASGAGTANVSALDSFSLSVHEVAA